MPETTTTVATTTTASVTTSPSTTSTQAPTSTTTTVAGPVVTLVDIALTGGTVERVERFDVPLDGPVRLTVGGDVSDEVHLHGYDLHADVAPGQDATIEFDATIPGVFEIELEDSGVLIGELQVAP
jgi:heme/copper-type cytochrome/quinol oxidase subunit 2